MKIIHIMLLSLLLASQSYALGNNERKFLLGLGAGVLAMNLIDLNNNKNTQRVSHTKVIYVDSKPKRHKKRRAYRYNNFNKDRYYSNRRGNEYRQRVYEKTYERTYQRVSNYDDRFYSDYERPYRRNIYSRN